MRHHPIDSQGLRIVNVGRGARSLNNLGVVRAGRDPYAFRFRHGRDKPGHDDGESGGYPRGDDDFVLRAPYAPPRFFRAMMLNTSTASENAIAK